MNKTFEYNGCKITIRFTPVDKFGVDRHRITFSKSMYKDLSLDCFAKTDEEIEEFARQWSVFQK